MSALKDFSAHLPEVSFESGTALMTEGGCTGRMFVLIDGDLAVLRGGAEIAAITEPGAIVGEISALLGSPHSATVIAKRASRARLIENGAAFLQSNPEIIFDVARVLASRLQLLSGYLADLKIQFADRDDHFAMVDEILCCLSQHHAADLKLGSERDSDPRL